ncbi:hypothetical protein [Candidatus Sneabacter namystus]|uniref:Uncharacterized protein n=1 Tax=Candidatus Sneabacter namystus TaxID=2601646 RepID=A0A5C0UIG0_9RICK|nr:hypothetical protein [Candidatus Sneabacter namystus]QEK39856.1 hypothetical protein FZC37_02910 [Candidatus Sneabacter namystus]
MSVSVFFGARTPGVSTPTVSDFRSVSQGVSMLIKGAFKVSKIASGNVTSNESEVFTGKCVKVHIENLVQDMIADLCSSGISRKMQELDVHCGYDKGKLYSGNTLDIKV